MSDLKLPRWMKISLWIVGSISFILLIIFSRTGILHLFSINGHEIDTDLTSAVGSIVGGILSPLVAIITVILYYHALELQRKELKETQRLYKLNNDQLERTSEALEIQSNYTKQQEWKNQFYTTLELFKGSLKVPFIDFSREIQHDNSWEIRNLDVTSIYNWLILRESLGFDDNALYPLSSYSRSRNKEIVSNFFTSNDYPEFNIIETITNKAEFQQGNGILSKIVTTNDKKTDLSFMYFSIILKHLFNHTHFGSFDIYPFKIEIARLLSPELVDYYNTIEKVDDPSHVLIDELIELSIQTFHKDYLGQD